MEFAVPLVDRWNGIARRDDDLHVLPTLTNERGFRLLFFSGRIYGGCAPAHLELRNPLKLRLRLGGGAAT